MAPAGDAPLVVPRHVRQSYLRTLITIALRDGRWSPAHEAVAELPLPVYVVTASDPGAPRLSEEENTRRNAELWEQLAQTDTEVYPAVGRSPEGDHEEEGWAVTGVGERRARGLGRQFGQWAIFELTLEAQIVIGCDNRWRVERPIDPDDWLEAPVGASLHEVVERTHGTNIVNDAFRFHEPGWRFAGTPSLRCWACGGELSLFVAEFVSRTGDHYGAAAVYCAAEGIATLPPKMPASVRRAVLAFRDYALARDDADAHQIVERGYWVYVIELDRAVPLEEGTADAVYVGLSAQPPEVRFAQHKAGYESSRWVRTHGVEVIPDLYADQPILRTHAEALTYERYIARQLESEGWTVKGGH